MAYSCWHITPIQIVAELRDPNKLKKPKRPDLIQAQAGLPLPYRQNPADLPNGAYLYDNTSDEESDQRSRLMMDIKKEPMDMHDQNSVSIFSTQTDYVFHDCKQFGFFEDIFKEQLRK